MRGLVRLSLQPLQLSSILAHHASLRVSSESIQRSSQGMRAAAVQVQSADYLKPLFKSLRSRVSSHCISSSRARIRSLTSVSLLLSRELKNLPADVLGRLSEIVHHMQSRQYQRANDSYLRLSIGTAAWPIGVTMVG